MLRILTAIMALLIIVSIVAPKANAAECVKPGPVSTPTYIEDSKAWIKCDYDSRHPIAKHHKRKPHPHS